MRRILASLILICSMWLAVPLAASAVTIDWKPVGNPGNDSDPATGSLYGSVDYSYNIGAYDVTDSQYVEFLNAKDPTGANTLGLYNNNMSDATYGGISYSAGNSDGSKYSAIPHHLYDPVNFVTWYDTLRFANWMNNGQGNSDTESGAYILLGGTPTPSNGSTITRNAGAVVFLPSENEWYKAAYYNSGTSSYFAYPTSNDKTAPPTAANPTAQSNSANYNKVVGNLTGVGAYTMTKSPYGAFDMGGDVSQWNESSILGLYRGLRGGSFSTTADYLLSSHATNDFPTHGANGIGFRLASTPPANGDLNLDGVVDDQDMATVANNWLTIGMAGDANHDGVVDIQDLTLIANHWLQDPGSGGGVLLATVPEPSPLVLAALGSLTLLMFGRCNRRLLMPRRFRTAINRRVSRPELTDERSILV